MTSLTFFGGLNEIGGNKILLNSNEAQIFLDFGLSFKKQNEFFEFPLLQPANIDDLLKTNLIPNMNGLYRYFNFKPHYDTYGPNSIIQNPEKCEVDGVLLSHAHMDHYGYLGLLRSDIPIFLSEISNKIIELYDRTGRNRFNEQVDHLSFSKLPENSEIQIGDLIIKRYSVDHSILGASAYLIEGKESIVYTGDFRLHGNRQKDSEEFLKQMSNESIDFLLCEGTRVGIEKNNDEKHPDERILSSEEEVRDNCIEIIESENNLIIYDASQADLERVKILSEVAKQTGRQLIIDSKKAFLLLYMNENKKLVEDLPTLDDFKILLGRSKLNKNSKNCKELTEDCPDFYLETFKDYRKNHERELLDDDGIPDDQFIWGPVKRNEILKSSNEYIIYTSNGPLLLLHCKQFNQNFSGTYIYGKAEPFNEEMEFTFNRLQNWLEMCNLKLEYAHTSGHCYPEDIKRAIETINPRYLIPIHTEHPEQFEQIAPKGVKIIRPQLNEKLFL